MESKPKKRQTESWSRGLLFPKVYSRLHRPLAVGKDSVGVNRGELAGGLKLTCYVSNLDCFFAGESQFEDACHFSSPIKTVKAGIAVPNFHRMHTVAHV